MKSKQFCSVCKEWLEMEVVPTGDGGDDDGVVWYRCPQCQGFLPKLKGSDPAARATDGEAGAEADAGTAPPPPAPEAPAESSPETSPPEAPGAADSAPESAGDLDEDLPWDSPADMMASRAGDGDAAGAEPAVADAVEGADEEPSADAEEEPGEPVAEYAALLAETDQGDPRPYRPWDTYEVGDCIMHLAWEDCGVVVAKEDLPGGRQVIKCYFAEAGVVRLIENAPR
jgi:hypothetical protein